MLYLVVGLIVLFAVASDQITKFLVVTCLSPEGTSVDVIPGIYRFTYVRNGNGMMGLFSENRWMFVILSLILLVGICIYFWKARPKNRLLCVSLGMIVGGGLGNFIDRVVQTDGKVIDFIDFYAFPKVWNYIYNVADIFVTVGGCLLVLYLILDTAKAFREEKAKKAELAATDMACAPSEAESGTEDVNAPDGTDACVKPDAADGEDEHEHTDA